MRIRSLHPIARRIIQAPKHQVYLSTMTDKVQPKFSEGENEGQLMAEIAYLLKVKWRLDDIEQGLETTFNFFKLC